MMPFLRAREVNLSFTHVTIDDNPRPDLVQMLSDVDGDGLDIIVAGMVISGVVPVW
jgi:hypothetical protein